VSTAIVIPGLTNSFKVPGNYRETKYGQGKVSIGAMPVKLVVTGTKTTAGSATADQDILPIYSEDDADAYFGVGSEIACQCYAALQIPGVTLYAAPVAENGAAVAGSFTITVGGTWSTAGTARFKIAGIIIEATIAAGDTTTTAATAIRDAINGKARLPFTAAASGAVVTVTTRSKGVRMNDYVAMKDLTSAPSGLTAALAGGTALTGGMVPFTNGAGADDVTNVLALLATDVYDIQAWAQNDTTNAALIKAQLIAESGPLIMHLEHAVFGKARALSTATSFASSTLNAYRCSVVWLENCEQAPSYMAAQVAAIRSVYVGDNPNTRYNDIVCPTLPPQSQKSDIPLLSELNTALNNGVTPLTTTHDGTVKIVRAIQSHCLNGSAPDYRTLDWGDVDVPDRMSKELGAQWDLVSSVNQYAGPDAAEGEEQPPDGVITPSRWNAEMYKVLKDAEASNWLQDVDDNLPVSEWNTDADRIMSIVNVVVRKQNHQVGISVRQQAA
jgi:phage tail sheath gpL-like